MTKSTAVGRILWIHLNQQNLLPPKKKSVPAQHLSWQLGPKFLRFEVVALAVQLPGPAERATKRIFTSQGVILESFFFSSLTFRHFCWFLDGIWDLWFSLSISTWTGLKPFLAHRDVLKLLLRSCFKTFAARRALRHTTAWRFDPILPTVGWWVCKTEPLESVWK